MENGIPLKDYVAEHGQTDTAAAIGVTQSAVGQMLRAGREIYVVTLPDGSVEGKEWRTVGRRST